LRENGRGAKGTTSEGKPHLRGKIATGEGRGCGGNGLRVKRKNWGSLGQFSIPTHYYQGEKGERKVRVAKKKGKGKKRQGREAWEPEGASRRERPNEFMIRWEVLRDPRSSLPCKRGGKDTGETCEGKHPKRGGKVGS